MNPTLARGVEAVRRTLARLPLHLLNGLSVAVGVALVQALVAAAAGQAAALMALTGAICASLADAPTVPRRTARRVAMAGLGGVVATMLVVALRPHPGWLGLGVMAIGFVSSYLLAWGPRAGPLSMVGVLALVFAMAAPAAPGWMPVLQHGAWALVGAGLYGAWAMAMSRRLQPAYRRLALAALLDTLAALLRSRADLLGAGRADSVRDLQAWIRQETILNDRLQAARDLLYEEPEADARLARQTALLLQAVDLRDTLLAGELDLNLIGADEGGLRLQQALSQQLLALSDGLDALREALQDETARRPVPMPDPAALAVAAALHEPTAAAANRERLLPALIDRARRMQEDLQRMQALWDGRAPASLGLAEPSRPELALFLSGESWSTAALRAQWHGRSPVLRHAARSALAMAAAYYLALSLPWSTHPHWLVLSVAVVLRGSLEQTLARRNARIGGTVIGCLLVLALAGLGLVGLSNVVFLVAIGLAHAYANVRYLVTAVAATLMALLQAHLAYPAGGFAVAERLADTLIGAGLAWAFCYVLPAWEHRLVPRAVSRLLLALEALAREALRWPAVRKDLHERAALGLARREAHDALAAIAAIAQRSSVEPRRLRLPLASLVDLLAQSQQMLSHLAAVRLVLTRRLDSLERGTAEPAMQAAAASIAQVLQAARRELETGQPQASLVRRRDASALPSTADLQPWFERRLRRAQATASEVAIASAQLRPSPGAQVEA